MKTVIIILGSARSGSTLLAKTIGGHTSCFAAGELNRFNQEINDQDTLCGCAYDLGECDFWNSVLLKLKDETKLEIKGENSRFRVGIFNQITRKNKIYKLINTILFGRRYRNKDVEIEIDNTFKLYEALFNESKSEVLIDSSKALFRALILNSRATNEIQFKFIHLIRDGRAILNSNLKSSVSVKDKDGVLRKYEGTNKNKKPYKIINKWIYINFRNYIILKLFYRSKCIFIRYEDFISDPSKFLVIIFKKINLSYEPKVLNLGDNKNHILGGNASRINAKKIVNQEEAWRYNLDKHMLKKINRHAAWFIKLMGYK